MSHFGKVETDVHINASAEKFHELTSSKTHLIGNVSSKINSVEMHQGEWGKVGSVVIWKYVHDEKTCVAKVVVEAIDPAKNLITFKMIEGDLLEHYKSFKSTMQVTPKDKGSVVHWTFEYKKLHGEIPNPHTLMQLAATMSREIDAHLTEGQGHEEQLLGKVEVDVHINASAEKFHEIFGSKPHHMPNISPGKVQGATVVGDWGKEGSVIVWHYVHGKESSISVIVWHYVHDGKNCVAKDVVEAIDPKQNLITFRVIEGDVLKEYKNFKFTIQVNPKDKGSVVHWTAEYEKLKGHIPDPHSLMQLFGDVSKDIDAHLNQ